MIEGTDTHTSNRRLAIILIATAIALCLGSVAYIDWFHSIGPGAKVARAK